MADYSIYAELGLDSKGFEKGVKKAQSSLSNFSSGIKTVTKTLGSLFAIGSIAQFTKEIGKMASSFNDARAEIVKGTGATGQALEQLSQSVTDALQNGVGRGAQEIGGMVADLNTRFGVMGNELTDLVDKFDMFSSVTGTDTRNAINSVADVMSKWGVETEQAGILLDQLTVASQESGASVEELEAGLKSGQAIFSQFGMSVTQSTAFLATLKKNGIDTGQALTGMRTALAKFSQEGRNAKTAFKETSESIKNARTETEALQIATEIFGTRSGAEMVRVLRSGSMSADEMASKLMNASGALRETDEASRTVKDALDDLKARFTALFSAFSGDNTLRDTIDRIGEAVGNINLEEVETNIRSFITTLVNLANNIGGIIKTIYGNFKELFNTVSELLGNNEGRFEVWKDNLYSVFDSLYRTVQDVFGLIKAILQGDWEVAWQYAKLAVMRAVSVILDNISTVANMFPNLINTMIDGLNKLIDGINKVREFFGQDLIGSLGEFTNVDLVDKTGLGKAIESAERKIEELTGKTADVQIKALNNVSTKRKKAVEETKEGEIDIQGAVAETSERITEIEKEEAEKRKEMFKAMLSAMVSNLKEWGKKAVETFKKVVSNIVKVISGIGNIFKNLFSFNVDEALDEILKFEDSILTFFVETLPRLPQFFKSVVQSITVLVSSIFNALDFGKMGDVVYSIIESLGKVLNTVAQKINSNAGAIISGVANVVRSIIQGLSDWIETGGWKEILNLIFVIQQVLENAVADNLEDFAKMLGKMIPDLVDFLIKSIVSASRTLGKIAKTLLPLIAKVINAIVDVITSDEVVKSSIEAVEGIVEGLVPAIVDILVNALPKIISFFLIKLPMYTPQLIIGVIDGLIKGFANVNWGETIKEIFKGLWESTIDFFTNLGETIGKTFTSIFENIKGTFGGGSGGGGSSGGGVNPWAVGLGVLTGGLSLPFFHANGTNNAQRGLAVVGEAGPELVRFNGGEQVLNTRNTQKAIAGMGGNSNTFNVNFTNVRDTSAYALVSQLKQYNRTMAINGVL